MLCYLYSDLAYSADVTDSDISTNDSDDPDYASEDEYSLTKFRLDRRGRTVARQRSPIIRGMEPAFCRANVRGYKALEKFLSEAAVRNVLEPGERVTEHTQLTALRQLHLAHPPA